jgi:hypothetical protein
MSSEIEFYPEVLTAVMADQAPLPVVCVNGKPKAAGEISVPVIVKELEALGLKPSS